MAERSRMLNCGRVQNDDSICCQQASYMNARTDLIIVFGIATIDPWPGYRRAHLPASDYER
jgi:hypothetical protein